MLKIAVTGGLASGKTTVCRLFQNRGAYVVNADEIVHQLLSLNAAIRGQVINLLGQAVVVNNQINRKKIAEIVFSHPEKLRSLETILHPAVLQEIEKAAQIAEKSAYRLFVAEIPLLYEIGAEKFFDAVIAVVSDAEKSRSRFQGDDFDKRMERQLLPLDKAKNADTIITNNGSIEELETQVNQFIKDFQ